MHTKSVKRNPTAECEITISNKHCIKQNEELLILSVATLQLQISYRAVYTKTTIKNVAYLYSYSAAKKNNI